MKDFILKVIVATFIVGSGLSIFYYTVSPYENCLNKVISDLEENNLGARVGDDNPFRSKCVERTNW